MSVITRVMRLTDRFFLRIRHPQAWHVEVAPGTVGFEDLRGHKYCLLTTFRASGEAVPTPVWFGLANGRLYLRSAAGVGKLKRIKNDPHVQIAPCTARGKPLGPAIDARARIIETAAEEGRAEAALRASYGLGRRLYESPLGPLGVDTAYVEAKPIGGAA